MMAMDVSNATAAATVDDARCAALQARISVKVSVLIPLIPVNNTNAGRRRGCSPQGQATEGAARDQRRHNHS